MEGKVKDSLYIVGIGSSAGGLKALEEFFDNCPVDTGFAFVIVQHLSPDHKSLMPELLSRHTSMKVLETQDGVIVEPNHVYLIPGGKNIQLKGGKLALVKRPPANQINFSIDLFFNSLALEQKEKSLAVILSGTGSDGTKGAKAIKEIGGTIFVQDPVSSSFDGMPRSVINQGLADYILPSKVIANELVEFVSNTQYAIGVEVNQTQEALLNKILKVLRNHVGYDFFSYKKPTLYRRTAKRINITRAGSIENYIDYLNENDKEKNILAQEYLIGVTKFFRDAAAFEILKNDVIPNIVSNKLEGESIKIWTVACSTGEEAYSISILLEEYISKNKLNIEYKVFATDLDEIAIQSAAKGVYNESIESEMPGDLLNKYFLKKEGKYQIQPSIRKNVIFSKHDILNNPPFSKMDLVSCRNMLIYLEGISQQRVLSSLHYSLNLNGYLFLGSSEALGNLAKNFEEISSKWKIYKNINADSTTRINRNKLWTVERSNYSNFETPRTKNEIEEKLSSKLNKQLINSLGAVCICVDEHLKILHAEGRLKKYIEYPEEGYVSSLLKMLPEELELAISTAVRKVASSPDLMIEKDVKFIKGDTILKIRLAVSVLSLHGDSIRAFLITLIEKEQKTLTEKDLEIYSKTSTEISEEVVELREELSETRENLQATIQELGTSNEEMQAANEELLASNEEMQSTNEELQSLNEELHTVNTELQDKNDQLIELNSDIENLMNNIKIGSLFLDKDFNIRKYTPVLIQHFQLRVEDVGRSIAHFSGIIDGEELKRYGQQVLNTLTPFKKEIKNSQGHWFSMQIFPYRSNTDHIQGLVINFIDINGLKELNSNLKKVNEEKEKLNAFLGHLMDYSPAIIYIYDLEERVNIYSSSSIAEIAGYTPEDVKEAGDQLFVKLFHPHDLQKIAEHHEKLLTIEDNEILQLEYRIIHKDTGENIWFLSTDKAHKRNENGLVKQILGTANIITDAKELEIKLKKSEERFRLAVSSNRSGLWEWSNIETDKAWFSKEFLEITGFSKEDLASSFKAMKTLIHPDFETEFDALIEKGAKKEKAFNLELLLKNKDNSYRWTLLSGKSKESADLDKHSKVVGTIVDIHARKKAELKLIELNKELEQFAYIASHDLKEPLRTISSFSNIFKTDFGEQLGEDALTYLDFIEDASLRMIDLTDDLLSYSRLGKSEMKMIKHDFNKVLEIITKDLKVKLEESSGTIVVKELPEIVCDGSQIRQLFQNLIVNALTYVGEGVDPKIEVGYLPIDKSYHIIYIRDNGIGIAEKNKNIIFDLFKRLHTREEYSGTGIGLANCKRIVDNHGGKIEVDSKLGEGTTFYIKLPKNSRMSSHG